MKGFLVVLARTFLPSLGSQCPDQIIRGVNLGGWLLLEPWITPKIFQQLNEGAEYAERIVDEYTLHEFLPAEDVADLLDQHWQTFITRDDLARLSAAGISHLRIPIGYWAVDVVAGEPFPAPAGEDQGLLLHLRQAINWAQELDMKVMVDLHGAPGSQNGFDNSGRRGKVHWLEGDNVDRTLVILDKLTNLLVSWVERGLVDQETIYGIALLNEPWGVDQNVWQEVRDNFYPKGYQVVRNATGGLNDWAVVVQQAFRAWYEFYGYMSEADGYSNVALDIHSYHAFGPLWNYVASLDNAWQLNLDGACLYHWELMNVTMATMVGEWSLAITDCQLYLQGGVNEPYHPGTGAEVCARYPSNFADYSEEYKDFLANFMLAQMDSFEFGDQGVGWFFWTAKTEENCAPEWDFLFLLEQGIAPGNLCERQNYCDFEL